MTSLRARAPKASSAAVRKVMQANVGRVPRIEVVVARVLRAMGLRYRTGVRPVSSVRCVPDFVIRAPRICVFVDGCFWHGCPRHFNVPTRNGDWWREKIAANRARDRVQRQRLRRSGWRVVRVWEHDVDDVGGRVARSVVRDLRGAEVAASTPPGGARGNKS